MEGGGVYAGGGGAYIRVVNWVSYLGSVYSGGLINGGEGGGGRINRILRYSVILMYWYWMVSPFKIFFRFKWVLLISSKWFVEIDATPILVLKENSNIIIFMPPVIILIISSFQFYQEVVSLAKKIFTFYNHLRQGRMIYSNWFETANLKVIYQMSK